MSDTENGKTDRISAVAFAMWLGSAGLGGGGAMAVLGPQLDKAALASCIDNSQIALNVAADHGTELQTIRESITNNRQLIHDRTSDRYTATDAGKDHRKKADTDAAQDRRIALIERQIDQLEDKVE